MSAQLFLTNFLAECHTIIDQKLNELVPAAETEPQRLHKAIRWSLFAGGKRFRPALTLAVGETFNINREKLISSAAALEMIHTYSLIHDDLPSMDNDDLRRGMPTCHVKFDEATAILAGDALQALAFQTIAEDETLSTAVRVKLVQEVTRAAGTPIGMVAGQIFDLIGEKQEITNIELEKIHRYKTGALIVAAARSGAIIAGANEIELNAISTFAAQLGLLFQITDDLLDVTATAADLGKTPGKDAQAEKATYPKIYGLEKAQRLALETHQNCLAALAKIESSNNLLTGIADFILQRKT
jgi:geranylgeranyl pyrophosphate synthase